MKSRMLAMGALLMALVVAGLFTGCGVAHFDDSGDFYDGIFGSSTTEDDSDPYKEQRLDLNSAYRQLIEDYNTGREDLEKVINQKQPVPEEFSLHDYSESYTAMGNKIDGFRDKITGEIMNLSKQELDDLQTQVDDTAGQLESLRDSLAKALEEAEEDGTSGSGSAASVSA